MASSIRKESARAPLQAKAALHEERLPHPIAITGVGLITLMVTRMLVPHMGIHGLKGAFVCYMVIGLAMPAIALAVALHARRHPHTRSPDIGQVLPMLFALLAGGAYVFAQHSILPVLVAGAGAGLYWWTSGSHGEDHRQKSLLSTLLYFVIVAICSAGTLLLIWPTGLTVISASLPPTISTREGIAAAFISPIVGIAAATLALIHNRITPRNHIIAEWLVTLAFAAVAICFAFSSYSLGWWVATHHWGVYVRPAQMVRDGGWLLWDVPSQYGVGSIASIAVLPFSSVWTSLHFLMGTLQSATALLIYAALSQALGAGVKRRIFAAVATFGALFLVPGFLASHLGQEVFPSIGAMRFFIPYAVIGLLIWEFNGAPSTRMSRIRATLFAGCLLWLIGVSWSSETGFYTTAVWVPAMTFLLVRLAKTARASQLEIVGWTILPFALLGLFVVALQAAYRHALGHGPDWQAYIDYTIAAGSGVFAAPMNAYGCLWVLFFAFAVCTTAAAIGVRRDGIESPAVALAASAAALVWSTSSYFVGRSTEYNVINLAPAFTIAVAAALITLRSGPVDDRLALPIKAFASALYGTIAGAVLLLALTQPGWFTDQINRPKIDVRSSFEAPSSTTSKLITRAGVRPGDRVAYLYSSTFPPGGSDVSSSIVDNAARLLPLDPLALDESLTMTRVKTYLDRFYSRRPGGGWLILPPTLSSEAAYRQSLGPWLSTHYDVVSRTSDGQTVVLRVSPRHRGSVAQPASVWSDLAGVPEVD